MNQQQIASWLRVTLAASGPIALLIMSKTGLSVDEYTMWLNLFIMLAPGAIAAVWGWWRNREDVQISVTKNLPSVAIVAVKDTANGKVGAMADDKNEPKVARESEVIK